MTDIEIYTLFVIIRYTENQNADTYYGPLIKFY